jgi:predicted nucleic acid-binding protein
VRIVDTSVLLPAVSPFLPQHESARHPLEAAIYDERPVGLTWVVVNAFLRLTAVDRSGRSATGPS